MANDCAQHAGQRNAHRRRKLDDIMRSLPENQAGGGRHTCCYCAYEIGFADGISHAGEALRKLLLREAGAEPHESSR